MKKIISIITVKVNGILLFLHNNNMVCIKNGTCKENAFKIFSF